MKIHTYLSSSGKDLIMEYINALTIEEQVDGLAVLAYMEKGEFEKVLSKRWDKKVYEVYFRRKNCVGGSNMAFLASFLQYFIKFVVFVILAVAGVFAGKKWRMSKDAKSEANEK